MKRLTFVIIILFLVFPLYIYGQDNLPSKDVQIQDNKYTLKMLEDTRFNGTFINVQRYDRLFPPRFFWGTLSDYTLSLNLYGHDSPKVVDISSISMSAYTQWIFDGTNKLKVIYTEQAPPPPAHPLAPIENRRQFELFFEILLVDDHFYLLNWHDLSKEERARLRIEEMITVRKEDYVPEHDMILSNIRNPSYKYLGRYFFEGEYLVIQVSQYAHYRFLMQE